MKKLFVLLLVGFFSLGLAKASWAAAYFAGNLGMVSVEDSDISDPELDAMGFIGGELSFDTGVGISAASGVATDILRVEGELSYRKNDLDEISFSNTIPASLSINGEVEAISLLANVYKDIDTNTMITPFIGLGVGFSRLDGEIEGISEDDMVFAYQLILGAGFEVSESTSIDVSYRYFATADPDFNGTELEYASHNVMLGVRFGF
jgi:opacity protein-like surface antigen